MNIHIYPGLWNKQLFFYNSSFHYVNKKSLFLIQCVELRMKPHTLKQIVSHWPIRDMRTAIAVLSLDQITSLVRVCLCVCVCPCFSSTQWSLWRLCEQWLIGYLLLWEVDSCKFSSLSVCPLTQPDGRCMGGGCPFVAQCVLIVLTLLYAHLFVLCMALQ